MHAHAGIRAGDGYRRFAQGWGREHAGEPDEATTSTGGREIPVAQVSRRDWHGMVGVRQGLDRKWAGRARAASGECRAGPASVGYVTAATTVTACTCHIRRRRPARGSAVGLPMEIADHIIRGNSGICKERNGECGTELSTVELPNWKPCWTGAMRINKSNIKAGFSLPLLSSPPTSSIPSRRRHPLPFRPCGTRGYPLPFQSRLAFVCLTPALVPVPLYLPSSPLFSPTMDMNYDESWCPTCDRQIMPKRFTVAVAVAQPEQPPPPAPPTPDSPSRKYQSILGLPPTHLSTSLEKPARRHHCAHLQNKDGHHAPKRCWSRGWPRKTQWRAQTLRFDNCSQQDPILAPTISDPTRDQARRTNQTSYRHRSRTHPPLLF